MDHCLFLSIYRNILINWRQHILISRAKLPNSESPRQTKQKMAFVVDLAICANFAASFTLDGMR